MAPATPVTRWLEQWATGDESVAEPLFESIYPELNQIASRLLCGERPGSVQAATLVNEAYLRLIDSPVQASSRIHFFAVAARVMRRILVDHARTRCSQKRGGGQILETLDSRIPMEADSLPDLLDLDRALTRLESTDRRKARIVDCLYFGGLTYDETAEALGISMATLHRDWRFARAWLEHELSRVGAS